MKRKIELEGNKSMAELSKEYYETAEEDIGLLEYIRKTDFKYTGNACMLAARYAEKMLKARLLRLGIDPDWGHDLPLLVAKFPSFEGQSKAKYLAILLNAYGTQASYPSIVRDYITSESAAVAYESALELVSLTAQFDSDLE